MIVPDDPSAITPLRLDDTTPERTTIVAGVDGSAESSEVTRLAKELADRLAIRLVMVPTHAAAEPPAHTLQAVAAYEQARLIVIGATHGDSARFPLSSSVATELPRLAPCPVIVVPDAATQIVDDAIAPAARRAA